MTTTRARLIELASAGLLFSVATALSMGQGGGPPILPVCRCSHANCTGKPPVAAQSCSCCKNPGPPLLWDCKACTINFDCVNPPTPFTMCLEGGV